MENKVLSYESPKVEVLDIEIEQGILSGSDFGAGGEGGNQSPLDLDF